MAQTDKDWLRFALDLFDAFNLLIDLLGALGQVFGHLFG